MARSPGLGRGLSSLIPQTIADQGGGSLLQQIPITSIKANRYQPRKNFEEESLVGLSESIAAVGVLQPILVRRDGESGFELIAGERRWRAARRAGLDTIPALVQTADDLSSLEQAVVENLHRADLNALEEAAAYSQLLEDFGLTHEELGRRVGKSRTAVTNTLRMLQLPSGIQRQLASGLISGGHARAILGIPGRALQEKLADDVVAKGLSVREVEEAVRRLKELEEKPFAPVEIPTRPSLKRDKSASLLELEEFLGAYLNTSVSVDLGKKSTSGAQGGKISVAFGSLEDLERIYWAIVKSNAEESQ